MSSVVTFTADTNVGATYVAQEFYEATVKHRRLQWYYHHGYANLRANFRSKPIDVTTNTTQATVLLLFNAGARSFQTLVLLCFLLSA